MFFESGATFPPEMAYFRRPGWLLKTLPEFGSLPSAKQKTLGKRKHLAKKLFAECYIFDTSLSNI
jgi:hypothetical protein